MAPWIIEHFPAHEVYVEPFGGAASVLLRKPVSNVEVYNDLDSEVYNLFKVLREKPLELIELLKLTPFSYEEFKKAYEEHSAINDVEKARRTIVKSFMGRGDSISDHKKTGFRNSKESNHSPSQSFNTYPECLKTIVSRLKTVIIENNDFLKVIDRYDGSDTLFYMDPPYTLPQRTSKHDYRHDFDEKDHVRFLSQILNVKGMVVVSGYENELYDKTLIGWTKKTKESQTNGSTLKTEAIWLCPKSAKAQNQLNLFGTYNERE